jgi:hypothetical protein
MAVSTRLPRDRLCSRTRSGRARGQLGGRCCSYSRDWRGRRARTATALTAPRTTSPGCLLSPGRGRVIAPSCLRSWPPVANAPRLWSARPSGATSRTPREHVLPILGASRSVLHTRACRAISAPWRVLRRCPSRRRGRSRARRPRTRHGVARCAPRHVRPADLVAKVHLALARRAAAKQTWSRAIQEMTIAGCASPRCRRDFERHRTRCAGLDRTVGRDRPAVWVRRL